MEPPTLRAAALAIANRILAIEERRLEQEEAADRELEAELRALTALFHGSPARKRGGAARTDPAGTGAVALRGKELELARVLSDQPMTLAQIVDAVGRDKDTVRAQLYTLRRRGVVERAETDRYTLRAGVEIVEKARGR